jgi:pimeloyl-ACP methyl ester carboxylesterase
MPKLILSKARPGLPWAARRAGDDYGAPAEPSWRDVDWQPYIHQREIDGRTLNFVDYGSGDDPPVLFIHGLGGCWQNWLEQIPRFGSLRRVIAVDLPGFGFSEMPREKITISGFGRAMASLCEQLGLDEVVPIGHSTGGFVGAELAIQHPDLVERLVLHSAVGISHNDLRRAPVLAGSRVVAAIGTRTAAAAHSVVVRPRLRPFIYGTFIRHPTRLRTDFLYEVTRGAGRKAFVPTLDALTSYDFRDRLPDIRCPTLVVWGREDMLVPVQDADEFERRISNSRKLVMKDTGHVPMLERPTKFNDCLMDFLAEPREAPRSEAEATV